MGFSAEFFGAELVAVVVAAHGDAVVGSWVDEQLESNKATQAANPATRMGCTLQEESRSSRTLVAYCAREAITVANTASNRGFACRADHGYRWADIALLWDPSPLPAV